MFGITSVCACRVYGVGNREWRILDTELLQFSFQSTKSLFRKFNIMFKLSRFVEQNVVKYQFRSDIILVQWNPYNYSIGLDDSYDFKQWLGSSTF